MCDMPVVFSLSYALTTTSAPMLVYLLQYGLATFAPTVLPHHACSLPTHSRARRATGHSYL